MDGIKTDIDCLLASDNASPVSITNRVAERLEARGSSGVNLRTGTSLRFLGSKINGACG
jgi:hypothetical protein